MRPDDTGRPSRTAISVAVIYFIAMTVGVTFPGIIPFNAARPFILGVPFVFVWFLGWIVGALAVFVYLYKSGRS